MGLPIPAYLQTSHCYRVSLQASSIYKRSSSSRDAPDVALTNETELKGMEIIMSEFS